jgi:hypothetical protein
MKTNKPDLAVNTRKTPAKSSSMHNFLDTAGAFLALGCSLHCALLPVALVMIPAFTLALSSFRDPHHGLAIGMLSLLRWEPYLLLGSVLLASMTSLLRRHRQVRELPWLPLLFGSVLFALALDARTWVSPWWHAGLMVLGGAVLSSVHITNLRSLSLATGQRQQSSRATLLLSSSQ